MFTSPPRITIPAPSTPLIKPPEMLTVPALDAYKPQFAYPEDCVSPINSPPVIFISYGYSAYFLEPLAPIAELSFPLMEPP